MRTRTSILREFMSSTTESTWPSTRRPRETMALTDYGVDPAVPYVLFVGRITRQKGVTHLVDAIRYLPDETQVVLCAGAPDTPEIATELRQKVEAARKDHPRIVWIEKMVTRQETIQLYSHARSSAAPRSTSRSASSTLRRWPAGRRWLRVRQAASKKLSSMIETGYLVPFDQDPVTSFPQNPEKFAKDLAARINALLQDEEKCKRFGDAGRQRVEKIFSWTAIAHQTIDLYQRLIEQKRETMTGQTKLNAG